MTAPADGRRLLVPLYVHPDVDPGAWAALLRAAPALRGVVLNTADGPGHRPDPVFRAAARRLRAAGVPLLGYVDTGYGHRSLRAALTDVRRHRRWYDVSGVFFDQVPAQPEFLSRFRRLALVTRALGAGTIVLNHGTHPDPGYAGIADLLITFEGPWEAYRTAGVPDWTKSHLPSLFGHLVYGVPQERADHVARIAGLRGAGVHCAVPGKGDNPWQTAPPPSV
ncbi:spherulation-specific family 4 protein [Streptomyces sp. I05A-00742]|uniref:spherulation-specific family 4 protein n=1 Tax=Streptomyces sp. I05A-00742 TaxID=2732853 RepID=UPI002897F186|nr:spherulation-specific family 4 protein [Streptomyces sp. I05A-00742]